VEKSAIPAAELTEDPLARQRLVPNMSCGWFIRVLAPWSKQKKNDIVITSARLASTPWAYDHFNNS
jgi:hypothetical protein